MATFNGTGYTFASFAPYAYATIWDQFWTDVLAEMDNRAGGMGGALPAFITAWDVATADANPGAGKLRANASLATATQLFISTTDGLGGDVSAVIGLFDDSTSTPKGLLRIGHRSNQAKWALFAVTGAVTAAAGYSKVPVSYIAGPGGFSSNDPLALGFVPKGDIGQTGATGGITGGNATGAINETAVTLASAATTDLGAAAGNAVRVTGTTTITALGTAQSGARRHVTFSGALTLTHNAVSLILPGSADIVTAAGDTAEFESLGGGNWRCMEYNRAAGLPILTSGGNTAGPVTATVNTLTAVSNVFTPNCNLGNLFDCGTIAAASTIANPTNPPPAGKAQYLSIRWVENGTGGFTMSFGANCINVGGTSANTAANKVNFAVGYIYSDGKFYYSIVKGA